MENAEALKRLGRHAQVTEFGAVCPQLPAKWLPYVAGNEDCLYLNIWTPRLLDQAKLPVIVFFNGGSNTAGYSQLTPLGPVLSPLGVVVVTANYRLGPFGFLAHPALTREPEHHSSGNYGLLDQLQALAGCAKISRISEAISEKSRSWGSLLAPSIPAC